MRKLKGCGIPMMDPNNAKKHGETKTKYTESMWMQGYLIARAQVKRMIKGFKRNLQYSPAWKRNLAMLLEDVAFAEHSMLGGIKQSTKNAIIVLKTIEKEELNCF